MPITGKFEADFSSFVSAVEGAEVKLRSFESGSAKVADQLSRMADSFSGRRVITEAQLMTEAISRIGSPARLTGNELQRVGALAAEAADKMTRMGITVPPKLEYLASKATAARGGIDTLRQSFSQFDGVLGSLGINLGPQVKAIEDIAGASGKTATQLGVMGTAGLAVGAGVAGWNIGRAVAGFFDLDKKVGDAAAKMFGFGDVSKQVAGVQADILARASRTAGFAITDLNEAMKINQAEAERVINKNKGMSAQFQQTAADAAKLQAILEANDKKSSKLFVDLAIAQAATAAKADAERAASAKKAAEEIKAATADAMAARAAEAAGQIETWKAHQEANLATIEAQRQARIATEAETAALLRQKAAAEAVAAAMTATIEYDLSTKEGREKFMRLNPRGFIGADEEYFKTHSLAEAIAAGLVSLTGRGPAGAPVAGSTVTSAGGGGSGGGAVVVVAPVAVAPASIGGRGTGGGRGDGVSVTINTHVSGVFDPAAEAALAKSVSAGLARGLSVSRRG